jgi:uncharacterized membrane protein
MDYQSIFYGAVALGVGLPRVVAPRRSHALTQQDVAKRIAEIEAGAPERYFEEYRALRAYPVTSSGRKWLVTGWIFVATGLVALVAGFMGRDAVHALLS